MSAIPEKKQEPPKKLVTVVKNWKQKDTMKQFSEEMSNMSQQELIDMDRNDFGNF